MHKVFISYHHTNDQIYKEKLLKLNDNYEFLHGHPIFIDRSVDTGDISEDLPDETIREKIRDDYLQDSTITILLVGTETKYRKHIDWELYSSMYNGKVNKQSGILAINLPTVEYYSNSIVSHEHRGEKQIYPEIPSWRLIDNKTDCKKICPYMPERIIDNLICPDANISVTNWSKIKNNPEILKFLIDITFEDRLNFKYNLKKLMRSQNFNPKNDTLSSLLGL